MTSLISSTKNDRIKYINSLSTRKNRWKDKRYVVEGVRAVAQLVESTDKVVEIIFSDRVKGQFGSEQVFSKAAKKNIEITEVSEEVYNSLTDTESPQYMMAVVGFDLYTLESVFERGKKIVMLDRVQDPGNLGTIIRTAEAMGFNGIVLVKGTVDVYSPKVLRATMGVDIPMVYYENSKEALNDFKKAGVKIVAAALDADKMLYDVEIADNIAVIVGNEANGVSEEIIDSSDELVKIPMDGKAESLNVAIATSMILYESQRQRILAKTVDTSSLKI